MNNLNHDLKSDVTCPLAFAKACIAVTRDAAADALAEWEALDDCGPLTEAAAVERLHESGMQDEIEARTSDSELLALYRATWIATLTNESLGRWGWCR